MLIDYESTIYLVITIIIIIDIKILNNKTRFYSCQIRGLHSLKIQKLYENMFTEKLLIDQN